MDPEEKKAYDLFSQQENLINQEPTFAAAFNAPPEALREGGRRARQLAAEVPAFTLQEGQRPALAGKRFPELQGIAGLLQKPLADHKEIAGDCAATPALLDRGVRLDQVFGRLVYAGHLLWRGGESGELLTAAAAQAVCQGVLNQAAARARDPSLTPEQRSAVSSLFAEPQRIEAEHAGRQARAKDSADRGEAPLRAQITEAQESAAMARVIEAYLENLRRRP